MLPVQWIPRLTIVLPEDTEIPITRSAAFDGMIELRAEGAVQLNPLNLYSTDNQHQSQGIWCTPYFAWGNQALGDMLVWICEVQQ